MALFAPSFRKLATKDRAAATLAVRRLKSLAINPVRPVYLTGVRGGGPRYPGSPFLARHYGAGPSDSVFDGAGADSGAAGAAASTHHNSHFKFHAAGASIPHPEKVSKGGEDASFVSDDGRALGVFDGVGAWSEMGVDPGIYSKSLAAECLAAYEELGTAAQPRDLLERAWLNSQHLMGSSTALCLTLDGNVLRGANLGDSGFLVVRQGQLLHRQKEQQHGFNFPFQLGTQSTDSPHDAHVVELELELGDVVVAATDGVLDNLFAEDIVGIVSEGLGLAKTAADLAQRIAHVASVRANSPAGRTPFSVAANAAGYRFDGGKLDDITVCVGILVGSAKL